MRTAISPRFAIRIFVNMRRRTLERPAVQGGLGSGAGHPKMPRVTTIPEALPDETRRSLPDQSRRWNLQAITTGLGTSRLRYTLYLYVASRLLFLAIAGVDSVTQHQSLASEMGNWDGVWYLRTA